MKTDAWGHSNPSLPATFNEFEKFLSVAMAAPRILIADTEVHTAELARSVDNGHAYRVVVAGDGREAFRMLKRDANFNLALFDLDLPHLDGLDVVRHMKTEKRLMRIPVIIVGTNPELKAIHASLTAGAIAFLPKPFSALRLHQTMQLALASEGTGNIAQAA